MTSLGWLALSAACAALMLGPAPARAQGTSSEADLAEARRLYEQGNIDFNVGAWDKAITEFKQAYQLSGAPGLLFNIGQAYRLAKRDDKAIFFYRAYLRAEPSAPNRADVETLVAAVEKDESAASRPASSPSVREEAEPLADSRDLDLSAARGPLEEEAGVGVAAGGVALAATGLAFWIAASSSASDLSALDAQGGTWSSHWQSVFEEGRRDALVAAILLPTGLATATAGAMLFWHGRRVRARVMEREAGLSVAPLSGGAGVTWACGF